MPKKHLVGRKIYLIFHRLWMILENITAIWLMVLFVLTCITVVLRYLFNSSIYGSSEISNYMFVYLTALSAPLLFHTNSQISVDLFENASLRIRKCIFSFQLVCMILLQTLIFVQSLNWISKVGDFPTPLLGIPQKYVQMAIPVCMGLGIFFCVGRLLEVWLGGSESGRKEE